jgi:hypothetical protein
MDREMRSAVGITVEKMVTTVKVVVKKPPRERGSAKEHHFVHLTSGADFWWRTSTGPAMMAGGRY